MATAWDAFVSYARSNSERTAIAVQRGLQRFARPWNQRRAVRIFRDDSAMSTNPALWSAIEEGLSTAGHLILLLSPAAAASAYVEKEVAWWLDHKGSTTILLVLDAGELDWDDSGNRFSDGSPVPACLRDAFAEEPRWLDLRWMRDSPD
ncbi:MAG TPA: TIR domain-containing protein, partial [Propionicimonas sp.]